MEVADFMLTDADRPLGFDQRRGVCDPPFHRLRGGEQFEGGAKLIHPFRRTVHQRSRLCDFRVVRVRPLVRVEIRQRNHGEDFAIARVHQSRCARLRLEFRDRRADHVSQRHLDRKVDGQRQRRALTGGVAQRLVHRALDARAAHQLRPFHRFLAGADAPEDMGADPSRRIDAGFAFAEIYAGQTQIMHRLPFGGRRRAFDPDKALSRLEFLAQLRLIHPRRDGERVCPFLGADACADHFRRVGVDRPCRQVRRQHPPLAVGDRRPAGRRRDVGGGGDSRLLRLRRRQQRHPTGERAIAENEKEADHA